MDHSIETAAWSLLRSIEMLPDEEWTTVIAHCSPEMKQLAIALEASGEDHAAARRGTS